MSKMLAVVAQMFEEQAALIQRNANGAKAMAEGNGDEVVHVEAPKKMANAPKDPNRPKRHRSVFKHLLSEVKCHDRA
jgi:hypothetical protein